MRTTMAIVGGLCWLVAGCGSSEPTSDTTGTPVVETGTINYAEGAFVRNPGSSTAGTGDAPVGTDATAATTTDPTATTSPGGATTTVAGGSADAPTTTVSAGQLGVGEGIITIGTVDYPFDTATCDVDSFGFFVLGEGTSSAGDAFDVDLSGETIDLDGDGTSDINFDIFVVPVVAAGADSSASPEFYASKVQTSDFSDGEDIVLTVTGASVSGSGPIEDFNGVAVPAGETLPMTFEVRCG